MAAGARRASARIPRRCAASLSRSGRKRASRQSRAGRARNDVPGARPAGAGGLGDRRGDDLGRDARSILGRPVHRGQLARLLAVGRVRRTPRAGCRSRCRPTRCGSRAGSMITTSMPNGRSSMRKASLSPSTAYLVAWYQPPRGSEKRPPTDEMLTMRPDRRARMCGNTSCVSRAKPKRLTSTCRRASSSGTSSTAPYDPYPALFTSRSMRPYRSTTLRRPRTSSSRRP